MEIHRICSEALVRVEHLQIPAPQFHTTNTKRATCFLNNGKQSLSFVFRCDYNRQWFRDQWRNVNYVSIFESLSLHRVILNDINWMYCLLCRTTENTRSLSVESDVANEKRKTLLHPHEEAERTRAASKYIHVCDYDNFSCCLITWMHKPWWFKWLKTAGTVHFQSKNTGQLRFLKNQFSQKALLRFQVKTGIGSHINPTLKKSNSIRLLKAL